MVRRSLCLSRTPGPNGRDAVHANGRRPGWTAAELRAIAGRRQPTKSLSSLRMAALGRAPTIVLTISPPLNTAIVGIDMTW